MYGLVHHESLLPQSLATSQAQYVLKSDLTATAPPVKHTTAHKPRLHSNEMDMTCRKNLYRGLLADPPGQQLAQDLEVGRPLQLRVQLHLDADAVDGLCATLQRSKLCQGAILSPYLSI